MEQTEQVGRYRLLEPLGEGGTSRVFAAVKATPGGPGRLVVLKRLRTEYAGRRVANERMRREAELAAWLDHPGLAGLLDAGVADDGSLYLVFEFVRGVTLYAVQRSFLEEGRLVPYAVSVSLAAQALDALHHAHGRVDVEGNPLSIVHRDLTPSNMMFADDGRARIIDFGVARVDFDDLETVPGTVVGTPRYLSPEQARGERVGPASDQYTLAVVLYELLTAQRLTPRGDRDAVMQAVVGQPAPLVHLVNPRLPSAISEVLQVALQKDPARRFGSAADFRTALTDAAGTWGHLSIDALRTFFRARFPEVVTFADQLERRAARAADEELPEVDLTLLRRAHAEAHVPTRAGVQPQPLAAPDVAATTRTDVTDPGDDEADPDELAGDRLVDVTRLVEGLATPAPKAEIARPRPQAPRLRRTRRRARRRVPIALAAAGVVALMGLAYAAGRWQTPTPVVAPAPVPPLDPPPPVAAVARPPMPAVPAEVDAGLRVDAGAPEPPPRRRVAPAAPPPPAAPSPLQALAARVRTLRSAPLDQTEFLRVHAALLRAADEADGPAASRARAHLSAAERSLDPAELAAALAALRAGR